jgi:diketogulonate reductase-like aldo/keto reductase
LSLTTADVDRTAKIKNLEENLAALKVALTQEENKEVREASEAAEVFGERYAPRSVCSVPSLVAFIR